MCHHVNDKFYLIYHIYIYIHKNYISYHKILIPYNNHNQRLPTFPFRDSICKHPLLAELKRLHLRHYRPGSRGVPSDHPPGRVWKGCRWEDGSRPDAWILISSHVGLSASGYSHYSGYSHLWRWVVWLDSYRIPLWKGLLWRGYPENPKPSRQTNNLPLVDRSRWWRSSHLKNLET